MFNESEVRTSFPVMVRAMDGTVYAGDVLVVNDKVMLHYLDDDTLPDSMRGHDEMVVIKSGDRSNMGELNKIHDLIILGTNDGKTFKTSTIWSNPARINRSHTIMRDGSLMTEDELVSAASAWKMKGRPKDRIIKGKTGDEVEDEMRARRDNPAKTNKDKSGDERKRTLLEILGNEGVSVTFENGSMSLDFNSCKNPIEVQSKIIMSGLLGRPDTLEY